MHFVLVKFNQIRKSNLSMYFLGSHFFSDQRVSVNHQKYLETVALLIIPYCNQIFFITVLRTRSRPLF